ncbi:DUF4381 domain-containing protein [Glaciecola sp. 1036]|uniref:DUF4381 domain-containing protein n=1 Tax=Alteromonadaceae TaxID=72275 RepID=UPI003D055EFA
MNPLDNLHDIQLPTEVSWWPLATGYWILIACCLIALVLGIRYFLRHRNLTQLRNQAVKQIQLLDETSDQFHLRLQAILKNVAQFYYPSQIMSLHGEQWQLVLESGKLAKQQPNAVQQLFTLHLSLYNPTISAPTASELKQTAILWLKKDFPLSKQQREAFNV